MLFSSKNREEQFRELYSQNFDYVYSFVFTRTAGDAALTEEIVQETFTAAWLGVDRFGHRSTYRTWLCAIAKNHLFAWYRKQVGIEKNQFLDSERMMEQDAGIDLESIAISDETRLMVQQALAGINPVYRYSLIMKYIDGYSVKEIAKHLGRTPKAVDGVLQKAKAGFMKVYLSMEQSKSHAAGEKKLYE